VKYCNTLQHDKKYRVSSSLSILSISDSLSALRERERERERERRGEREEERESARERARERATGNVWERES